METMNDSHPTVAECRQLMEDLPDLPVDDRIQALESLIRASSADIRQHTLHLGSALLSDDQLVSYLRNDDDAILRNAGLEILKMRGGRGFRVALDLLEDPDPDVALQAVLILDHLKNPRALEPLLRMLPQDDPNLVQAAIVAIGHLGDSRAVEDLIPFLDTQPWLQMAAIEALGDLRCPEAVEPLTRLLTDLMLGPMAAEALARIGGTPVFQALAEHWMQFREQVDAESMLGLLAHVLEGLAKPPPVPAGLRASIEGYLDDDGEVAGSAARILLACGAGPQDDQALETLSAAHPSPGSLPACLRLRWDLCGEMLTGREPFRSWGLLLTARFPEEAPLEGVVWALRNVTHGDSLPAVVQCLGALRNPQLDEPLVDLYLRLPSRERLQLHASLAARKDRLRKHVDQQQDLPVASRLELLALMDEPAENLVADLLSLDDAEQVDVVAQLFDRPDVLRRMPWLDLLARSPDTYAALAADAAACVELRELLPRLRELLEQEPRPALIRAVGELGDREAVPLLSKVRGRHPELDALVLKALGEIGGSEAREELRRAIHSGSDHAERIAYRALSMCATEKDEEIFLEAANHGDWNVRLAAAEVLGRAARDRHLASLARLASDPVAIVSQRALSFLES